MNVVCSGIRGTSNIREVDIGVACICIFIVCNVGPGPACLTAFLWFSAFRPVKRYYLRFFFINPKHVALQDRLEADFVL